MTVPTPCEVLEILSKNGQCSAIGLDARGFFVNRDPRGYALKFDDATTRQHNLKARLPLHSDWGGYGILAPDLSED